MGTHRDDRRRHSPAVRGLLALLVGVGLGGTLVRCRAPLAPDLADALSVAAGEAAWTRALGLAAAALIVAAAGSGAASAPATLLLGVAAGVASRLADPVDGALFVGSGAPTIALVPWIALAVVAACLARRGASPHERSVSPLFAGGLALGAAGIAVEIEGLSRLARRLGLGTPEDDAVFAAVFAVLAAIGAATFGRAFVRTSAGHVTGALFATAAVGVLSLAIVAGIAEPLGFKALCARFGADASLAGTLRVDGAVALFAFLLPALGAGTCAYLARGTLPLAALLVGAAAGTAAAPELLSSAPLGWLTGVDERDLGSSGLVPTGAVLAALGIVACATELAGKARRAGVAVGAISVVGAVALPVSRVPVLDPWQRFPVKPIAVFETAAGQFIVEPGGGDVLRAMLDQRPLSPRIEELRADAERIAAAVRGVPGPAPKSVLLVGVLTPDRAMVLEELGVERVDRTAHFAGALEPLEALLFQGLERPTGDVLSANEAIDRARRSDYGVVIVLAPGTRGSLGAVHDDGLAGAPTALWLDGRRPVAHLDWTDRVLLASSGIESFSLALTAGLDAAIEYESAPAAPAPRIWSWLRVRPDERPRVAWRDAAERIAAAPVAGDFERGLARHAAVQRISSPFETRAQRVELDDEALASWRDHAVASEELSPFEVGVVEGLTRTIEGKREVPLAYEFVEPILDARPGWVALARTLAWADGEELDFDGAARRLEPYWRSEPLDARTARAYARALVEAGRPREAVDALRPISEARPEDRSLRTQLAEALVVADDPEGRRIAAELLREDPTNALLFDLARGTRGLDTLRSGATTPDDR